MNYKNIVFIIVLTVALGVISYFFVFKNSAISNTAPFTINPPPEQLVSPIRNNAVAPTTLQSLSRGQLLSVNFPLKSGHELYMEYDERVVPSGWLFDLEVSSGKIIQIKNVDELSRVVDRIDTVEQASAFVNFFTSKPSRFLLQLDPFEGIEPSDAVMKIPSSPSKLLTPAKIDKVGGQWVIERDLLMYPVWVSEEYQIPVRLVRSHETISQTGMYSFSISKVLAAGNQVPYLLPYYE